MDPTESICINSDFGIGLLSPAVVSDDTIAPNATIYPPHWSTNEPVSRDRLDFKIKVLDENTSLNPVHVDPKSYFALQMVKRYYDEPGVSELLRQYRDHPAVNPFGQLPRLFIVRAGMKLANINGVFPVLGDQDVSMYYPVARRLGVKVDNPREMKDAFAAAGLRFLDIGGAPGGFIEYIDKRVNGASGVSFSLSSGTGLDWNEKLRSRMGTRLTIDKGDSGDGDIFKNWSSWAKKYKGHFDFVSGDIGFPTADWERKELIIQRAILHEIWLGTACLKRRGNLVVKTMDLVTEGTGQILEMFSKCYELMYVMKPVTSRPTNEERYVIFSDRKDDNIVDLVLNRTRPILRALNKAAQKGKVSYITQLRNPGSIIPGFRLWLMWINNRILEGETEATSILVEGLKTKDPEKYFDELLKKGNVNSYDINKALIVWNIQDFPGTMLDA